MSLNDFTYSELAVFAGKLSMMAKKPISLGMAISLAVVMSENFLKLPGMEEGVKQKLSEASPNIFTPEEFDSYFDGLFKEITNEKK